MKISLIMLFVAFQLQAATGYAQKISVPIHLSNTSVEEVLNQIEKNSDYVFLFNDKNVNTKRIVSLKSGNHEISKILNEVFAGTNVKYTIVDKQIILSVNTPNVTQDNTIPVTGIVKDANGDVLIGVTVLIKGTNNGTISGLDGDFSIKARKGDILQLSYIGYASQDIKIVDNKAMVIVLQEDARQLGEVVITAMGIERKEKSLTYATQKVNGDELMKVQDANFVNALQGKAAGVTITPSAGGAGGASKILLRGNKSILGNNTPLIVVDGIPMTNNVNSQKEWGDAASLTYASAGEGSDPLSTINPDDIESLNILKGANAAALYGSAAANGVIMITTKKGKEGSVSINVSSSATFETPLLTPKIQNVYGASVNLSANTLSADSWGKKLSDMTSEELAYGGAHLRNSAGNDVDDFFRTGVSLNNSVSISGGSEKIRTYFSYANSHSNGMIEKNTYNRNSFSFRQNYALFKKKLNVDFSINYVQTETKNRPGGGTVLNPLYDLYTVPRNVDMQYYRNNYKIDNGTWTSNQQSHYSSVGGDYISDATIGLQGKQQQWVYNSPTHNNPYWGINENRGVVDEQRVNGYISASYELFDGLKAQGRLSLERISYKGVSSRSATTWNVSAMEDYGMYGQDLIWTNDVYVDALLSYNKDIKDFSVSATVGWVGHTLKSEVQKQWTLATTYDPNRVKLSTLINFFQPTASSGNPGERSYYKTSDWNKGMMFTGQVGYQEKIYIEGSYRRDWYRAFKQFAPRGYSDNYGYFSVGANALISNIVKLPEAITNLKVRASYSEVGNSIPNVLFNKGAVNPITGAVVGSNYGRFQNPIPEKTRSFEAGFDVSFFGNALNWDLTYYHSAMHNSYLLNSNANGKSDPVNSGVILNSGVETTLGYSLNIAKDLIWKTLVNFSYNNNEIKETYQDKNGEALIEQSIAGGKVVVRYKKGGSYGDMYAKDFVRNADGSIKLTRNGNPQLSNKYVYIGNMNSKFQLGWSNTFTYKNVSLYFLINGRIGGKVISLTEASLDDLGVSQRTADARLAAENNPALVWNGRPALYMPDGNLAPIDAYYREIGNNVNATQYVYDATNFRLGEISLGYTFRNLLGMSKHLSLSFVARNLFFIYKNAPVDPDVSLSTQNGLGAFDVFNMPSARSYGISLKANF